jgi:hypothetical protein
MRRYTKQPEAVKRGSEFYLSVDFAGLSALARPSLADQLRTIVARLPDMNEFDRNRLGDIIAAIRRKETALDMLSRGSYPVTSDPARAP